MTYMIAKGKSVWTEKHCLRS